MAVTDIRPEGDELADLYSDLENRESRQLAGICVRKGCGLVACSDSDYCDAHAEAQRAYNRGYAARQRKKRASARQCTRCGGRRKAGSRWCAVCLIRRGRIPRPGLKSQLENRVSQVRETDGWTRNRFRGQPRTGPQSRAALDAQDFDDAIKRLARARDAVAFAHSEEVRLLPAFQRRDAEAEALGQLRLGLRHGVEIMKRHKADLGDLVGEEDD